MVEASLFFAIISTILSLYNVYRRPTNAGAVVSVLSALFGYWPGYMFAEVGLRDFYSFRTAIAAGGYLFDTSRTEPVLLVMSLMIFAFSLATSFAIFVSDKRAGQGGGASFYQDLRMTDAGVLAAKRVVFYVWLALMLVHIARSGSDLRYVFLPVVRKGMEAQSGYFYTALMSLPVILMITEMWRTTPSRRNIVLYLAIAILTCLTTHQRREIVTVMLAATGVFALLSSRKSDGQAIGYLQAVAAQRRIALQGLAIGLLAVPLTWYARIYATNLAEGRKINPFEIRGIGELLMGSPSTAFPALTLIYDYVDRFGISPLRLVFQILATPIPRAIWSGKPGDVDGVLQAKYRLIENPSSFWMGELYFNFGIMAVLISFVFGYYLTFWHEAMSSSKSRFANAISVVMFSYSVTLFKNGVYTSVIRGAVVFVLLLAAAHIVRMASAGGGLRRLSPHPARR